MRVKRAFKIWLLTSNQASLCVFRGRAWFNIPVITRKRIAPETATTIIQIKRTMFIGFRIHSLANF
ncbi:hypothetical protein HanPI659440_Chr14g0570791 [Helianthus annuus]|nr:hypothetical protein HanPI659440_Chr14g0570791 [Helianthus annuus]